MYFYRLKTNSLQFLNININYYFLNNSTIFCNKALRMHDTIIKKKKIHI